MNMNDQSAQIIEFVPRRHGRPSQGASPSAPGTPPPPVERTGATDTRPWCPDIPEHLDSPPSPTEISEAGMYAKGQIEAHHLVEICGSQIRAGRALDAWLRKNGRAL